MVRIYLEVLHFSRKSPVPTICTTVNKSMRHLFRSVSFPELRLAFSFQTDMKKIKAVSIVLFNLLVIAALLSTWGSLGYFPQTGFPHHSPWE